MKILMEKQYNLLDIMQEWAESVDEHYNWRIPYTIVFSRVFEVLLHDSTIFIEPSLIKFADYDTDTYSYIYKDYIEEMLNSFWTRYYKYFATSIITDDEYNEKRNEFIYKFINVLNITYPKYAPIIKALTDNENKLMDALARDYEDSGGSDGSVTQRFNDTPQDGGAFDDDNHTTNINESVSNSTSSLTHTETYDNKYVLEKINYIRDNLSNIYTEWENKVATILWR